jgi:hypothetical protein
MVVFILLVELNDRTYPKLSTQEKKERRKK